MVDVFALVVATIAAVSGLVWMALGIAGWTGVLRRNRYFGIRSAETMRSEQAFATANRVVAPGLIATGVLALVAAGLAVSERGLAGIVLGLIGTMLALALVGLLSGTAIKAAAAIPVPADEQPSGCGSECGCGSQSGPDAGDTEARVDDESDICGTGAGSASERAEYHTGTTCGSCEMRDACFDGTEHARA